LGALLSDTDERLAKEHNPLSHHRLTQGVRLFLNAAKITFRVTGRVLPRLAAQLAIRLFMTPKYLTLLQNYSRR
jgi:hypothetical protein